MKTLIEQIKARDSFAQFNTIPAGQDIFRHKRPAIPQNFGEYIFEHYRESEDYFRSGNNTTGKE